MCKCDHNKPYLTNRTDHDDLKLPSPFPYAISVVCKEWLGLMLAIPDFWTCLIVFVDENPSAIGELRSHLCASRELSFRAQVLNREGAIGEDIEEGV